jgi:hypothetical protein
MAFLVLQAEVTAYRGRETVAFFRPDSYSSMSPRSVVIFLRGFFRIAPGGIV